MTSSALNDSVMNNPGSPRGCDRGSSTTHDADATPGDAIFNNLNYQTTVWSRNCGATTAYNTRVFVQTPSSFLGLPGTDEQEAVLETRMAPGFLTLRWIATQELVIEYEAKNWLRPQKTLSVWKNIPITYKPR